MTDAELIAYVQEFRDGLLEGHGSWLACMKVCAPLATLLDICGVQTEMMTSVVENDAGDGCNHVFLRLADGRVLDPTSDQFNGFGFPTMPPVYLGPPERIHRGARPWRTERETS
jgi:hypothetical protein